MALESHSTIYVELVEKGCNPSHPYASIQLAWKMFSELLMNVQHSHALI